MLTLSLLKNILIFLIFALNEVNTQQISPCSSVFQLEKLELGKWTGNIKITTSETLFGIWLRIILTNKVNVLINWFGDTTTIDNKEFLIKNRNTILKPGDDPVFVNFTVEYDHSTIPNVEDIKVNGRSICINENVGQISTSTERQIDRPTDRPTYRPTDRPTYQTTARPIVRPPETIHIIKGNTGISSIVQMALNQCGIVPIKGNPLITLGQPTEEGDWPWHLAIYSVNGDTHIYICGGTLVSQNFVITAAHCVTIVRTNEPTPNADLKFYLGTSTLKLTGDGLQEHRPSRIIIHPEYNPTRLFNDIAVIKLDKDVTYTNFVRPICLWEGDNDITKIEQQAGTVVGWGFDENMNLTENLMMTALPIVSLSTCLYSNRPFFSTFLFEKNYCAGFTNGTSVCNGDSGGGMVFRRPNSQVWQLRGIVSVGVSSQKHICDPMNYVIFTDVAKYLDWIKEKTQ